MNLVFLESAEHLKALLHYGADPRQTECWVCDAEMAEHAKQSGFSVRILQENDLREEFGEINPWARGKALDWFTDPFLCEHLTFSGVNLLDAVSHFTSYSLAWLVGCYRMIALHFEKNLPGKILFFECPGEVRFGSVLAAIAEDRGIPTEKINLPEQSPPNSLKSLKEKIRQTLGNIFRFWNKSRPYPKNCFVFCGGLRHLAPLIADRKDSGALLLLENLFQAEQFRYCCKNHLRYSLFGEWLTPEAEKEISSALLRINGVRAAIIGHVEQKKILSYRGERMAHIETFLIDILSKRFSHCLHDIAIARKFSENIRPRAVILDDDTSNLRPFALALRREAIEVFVLAHGEMGLNYRLPVNSGCVSVGTMFVNSSYSEAKHASVGWQPEKLIVTGLPQYDRIAAMIRSQTDQRPRGRKKVLYCPHYMAVNAIKSHKAFGDCLRAGDAGTRLNNEAVLDAIETVDCEFWIKFYRDETEAWRKYLIMRKIERMRCFHHSEDIFRLLSECDVLIGGEFSTIILEGMMSDKPVISLNFSGLSDVHPYAQEGLVQGVYRPEDLPEAIRTCLYDEDYLEVLRQKRRQRMSFYWSGSDGHSTERVWQKILELTETRDPVDFKNEVSGSGYRQSTSKEHCLHGN